MKHQINHCNSLVIAIILTLITGITGSQKNAAASVPAAPGSRSSPHDSPKRSGLVEAGTAPRVGRLLGARWLVSGAFSAPTTETIRVASALLEVPENELLALPPVDQKLSEL